MIYESQYVEDLFQEVMIHVWRNLSTFRGDSSIDTWLYRITVNTAITFNNREKRKKEKDAGMKREPEPTVQENPLLDEMYEAIHRLSEDEKTIISLFLEGFAYKEISAILGITTSNVGVRINRIRNKLSEMIKNKKTT